MPDAFLQEVCLLVGDPVVGNPTQYMMEKAFAQHGLDWRFLSCEVKAEALADAVRGFRALGFRGATLIRPHTVAAVELVDRLSERAQTIGAVNCLVREGDELVGENSDGAGFLRALEGIIDPAGKHVVVLGAGGAARAIGVELGLAGASRITIVNRTPEAGQRLAELIRQTTSVEAESVAWAGDYDVPADADLLVQATSIGLTDPEARVPVAYQHGPGLVVADVVFNPPETQFLVEARHHGCKTIDGLGMMVHQGAIALERWTGVVPDLTVMREAAEEFLSS